MGSWSIALLGAIAGFTIFLGLPFGRVRNPSLGLRVFLNGTAIGILLFLLWDVLVHAVEPVEAALTAVAIDQTGTWARFAELAATVAVGIVVGLMSLVYYERWLANGRTPRRAPRFGPGAAAAGELTDPSPPDAYAPSRSERRSQSAVGAPGDARQGRNGTEQRPHYGRIRLVRRS